MKRGENAAAPPPQRRHPGRIRAIALAVIVHALFFAVIVFGVSWQSSPTPPVEAELWDKLPPAKNAAAPRVEPAKPQPKPEPPKPEPPKPEPPKPEAKPEPPRPDPAIALKAEREKREKEKVERERREQLARLEKEKVERKREQEQKKLEDEKRAREEQAARAEAQRKAAEAASARQKEFDRWVAGIRDKIRNRANIPDTVTGKPEVQVRIRILPGGEVLDITITKRSGNPTYDAAIERAIRSASPLPVPSANSELFPQFRELNLNIQHER